MKTVSRTVNTILSVLCFFGSLVALLFDEVLAVYLMAGAIFLFLVSKD